MSIVEIILIGIGLAMDSFAVSVCKGLSMKKLNRKNMLIIAFYFGLFQGGMPILGYYLGTSFESLVTTIDHWIAFALLSFIGINMIREAFSNENKIDDSVKFSTMIILALATSIDALAVGISFAFLDVNILFSALVIFIITFILSLFGVILGNKFGNKYEKISQILGGTILILMAFKILFEHLGLISF